MLRFVSTDAARWHDLFADNADVFCQIAQILRQQASAPGAALRGPLLTMR